MSNISKQIFDAVNSSDTRRITGEAPSVVAIDHEAYAPYFPEGQVYPGENIDRQRAINQPHGEQVFHAGMRLLNFIPKAVGYTAAAADLVRAGDKEENYSNWLTDTMLGLAESWDEKNPIYRENPDRFLDMGDPAWWASSVGSVLQELPAFYIPGYGVGRLAGWGARALGILNKLGAAAKTTKALQALTAQAGSAYAMTKIESTLVARDVYKDIFEREMQAHGNEGLAKQRASQSAAVSYNSNRANFLLNMTMAGKIMKAPYAKRVAVKQLSKLRTAKHSLFEAGQEALEEGINLWAEKEGQRAYDEILKGNNERSFGSYFTNFLSNFKEDVWTREGAEAMFLGAIGGAGMTMGTAGMNMIERPEQYTDPETGETKTRWISPNEKHQKMYEEQQEMIKPFRDALGGEDKQIFETLLAADKQANHALLVETAEQLMDPNLSEDERKAVINLAASQITKGVDETQADYQKRVDTFQTLLTQPKTELEETIDGVKKNMLEEQVWQFSQAGGLDNLLGIYQDISEKSEEQAIEEGFAPDYVEKANKAIEYINNLADEYDAHAGKHSRPALRAIYKNRTEKLKGKDKLSKLQKEKAEMEVTDDNVAHAKGLDLQIERQKTVLDKLDEKLKELKTKEGGEKIMKETKEQLKKLFDETLGFSDKVTDLFNTQQSGGRVFHNKSKNNDEVELQYDAEKEEFFLVNENGQRIVLTPDNIDAYSAYSPEEYQEVQKRNEKRELLRKRKKAISKLLSNLDAEQKGLQQKLKAAIAAVEEARKELEEALKKQKESGFAVVNGEKVTKLIERLQNTISTYEEAITVAEDKLELIESQRSILNEQLKKVKQEILVDYQELQEDIEEFLDRMKDRGFESIQDFDKYIQHVKKRIAGTKGEITKLKNRLAGFEELLSSAEALEIIREEIQRMNRFEEKWPEEAELLRQVNYVIADLPNTSQIGLKLFPNFAQDVTDYITLMEKRRERNVERVETQNKIYLLPAAIQKMEDALAELQEDLELLEADRASFIYATTFLSSVGNLRNLLNNTYKTISKQQKDYENNAPGKENASSIMGPLDTHPPPNPKSQDQKATKEGYKPMQPISPFKTSGKQVQTEEVDGIEQNVLDDRGRVIPLETSTDGEPDGELSQQQEDWYAALNDIGDPTQYTLRVVPYEEGDEASEMFFTTLEKRWNKKNPKAQPVKLVLYKKGGKLMQRKGRPIVTRLPAGYTVEKVAKDKLIKLYITQRIPNSKELLEAYNNGEELKVPDGQGSTVTMTEDGLYTLALNEFKENLQGLRDTAYKNGKEKKATFVSVLEASQGVPNLLPARDGVRQQKKIKEVLNTKKVKRIFVPKHKTDYPFSGKKPNMSFNVGSIYIETQDGRIIEALQRTINSTEAMTLLGLFHHGFGKQAGETGGFGTLPVQWASGTKWDSGGVFLGTGKKVGFIDQFLYFGKRKEGTSTTFEIYFDTTDKVIKYGGDSELGGSVHPNKIFDEKGNLTDEGNHLHKFLLGLRRNVNKRLLNEKANYVPVKSVTKDGTVIVESRVQPRDGLTAYEAFLLDENSKILSSDLTDESGTQFLNRYLIFDPKPNTRGISAQTKEPTEEPTPQPEPPTEYRDLKLTEILSSLVYALHSNAGQFIVKRNSENLLELVETNGQIQYIGIDGHIFIVPKDEIGYIQGLIDKLNDYYLGKIDENSYEFKAVTAFFTKATVYTGGDVNMDDDFFTKKASRRLTLQDGKSKPLNLAKAERWLKKVFGNTITVELAEDLIEAGAAAEVFDNIFRFTSLSEEGEEYHEAIHYVARKFLSKEQYNSIISEARSNTTKEELASMLKKVLDKNEDGRWLDPDGNVMSNETAERYALEEIIAEDFRNYMLEGESRFKKNEKWYETLWNAVKDFLGIMKDNRLTIEDLYNNLNQPDKFTSNASPRARRNRRTISLQGMLPVNNVTTFEFFEGMAARLFNDLFNQETAKPLFVDDGQLTAVLTRNLENFRTELFTSIQQSLEKGIPVSIDHKNLAGILYNRTNPKDNPEKSRENYEYIISEFKDFLVQYGIDISEAIDKIDSWDEVVSKLTDEETGEITTHDSGSQFNDVAAQYDTKDHTPKAIRMLIASILTGETNSLGLPIMNDFSKTYIKIAKILAGSTGNYDNMIKRIDNEGVFKNEPVIKEFVEKLKKYSDDHGERLRTHFAVEFSNSMNTFLTTLIDKENIYSADTNNARTERLILANWEAAFKQKLIDNVGSLNFTQEAQQKFISRFNLIEDLPNSDVQGRKETLQEALEMIGIELSDMDTATTINLDDDTRDGINLEQLTRYVVSTLQEMIKKGAPITADKLYQRLADGGIYGRLKQIAEIEAMNNKNHIDLQSQSSDGKTIFNLGLHTNITTVVSRINEIIDTTSTPQEREAALKEEFPHLFTDYQASSIIWNRVVKEGRKIHIVKQEGARRNTPGAEGTVLKAMSMPDRLAMFVNGAMEYTFPFLRAADRGVEDAFQIEGGFLVETKKDMIIAMVNHLEAEMKMSWNLKHKGEGSDIRYYNEFAKELRVFKGILPKELRELAQTYIDNPNPNFKDFTRSRAVDKAITDWITGAIKDETTYLRKHGIFRKWTKLDWVKDKKIKSDRIAGISQEHIRKHGSQQRVVELYAMNSILFYMEQMKIFVGDPAYYKNITDNFKRFSMFNSTKEVSRVDSTFNQWLLNNRKRPTQEQEDAAKRNVEDGVVETIVYADHEFVTEQLDYILERFDKSFDKDEELTKKSIDRKTKKSYFEKAYKGINEADAFGVITIEEYRHLLERAAQWTDGHEAAYQKIMEGKPLRPSEMYYFQPQKTQYTGPLYDKQDTLHVPTGYKHVLMPIYPQLVKNTNMERLYKHMQNKGIGIAQFISGNKFGTILNEGEVQPFYAERENVDGDGNKITETLINTNVVTQRISYKYFGIQQKMTPKVKTDVTPGSQAMAHVIADAYNNGSALKNQELLDRYHQQTQDLLKYHFNKLKEKFDIHLKPSTESEVSEYIIGNKSKFIQYIKEEVNKRNPDDNVLNALSSLMLKDTKIDELPNHRKIQNLIFALVQSKAITAKRPGRMFVQTPTTGFEPTGKGNMTGDNYLEFYKEKDGKILPAEVEIPLPKAWIPFMERHYGSLEKLNEAIKGVDKDGNKVNNSKLPDSLLKFMGFRIPTQGMNSIEYMKIVGFLPPQSAETIRVPSLIVAKAGSDYDVDKLTLYFANYTFDENGVPVHKTEDERSALENQLLQTQIELIEQTDYRSLTAPVDDRILKETTTEIRNQPELTYTDLIRPSVNMDKFYEFLAGKMGVAQTALQSTNHILAQAAGLHIQEDVPLYFDHNKTDDGLHPSLAKIHDSDGNRITETLAAFLTAYVDIAKEPYVFHLNFTNKVADTIFYMLRLGADPVWLAHYMAQPMVSKYVKQEAIRSAEIFKGRGIDSDKLFESQKDLVSKIISPFKDFGIEYDGLLSNMQYTKDIQKKQGGVDPKLNSRITLTRESYKKSLENLSLADLKQTIGRELTQTESLKQVRMLDAFLEYSRQAKNLGKLIKATNLNTGGVGQSIEDTKMKQRQKQELLNDGFFNADSLERMFSHTYLGEFEKVVKETDEMFSPQYFTMQKRLGQKMMDFKEVMAIHKYGDKKNNAFQAVQDDFLLYMVMTLKDNLGNRLLDVAEAETLLGNNSPVFQKLRTIKQDKNHKLHSNRFIQEVVPDINNKENILKMFNKKKKPAEINTLLEDFYRLKEVDAILANNIVKISLLQHGLTTAPNSYQQIIPVQEVFRLLSQAKAQIPTDNGVLDKWFDNFKHQFQRNRTNLKFLKTNQPKYGKKGISYGSVDLGTIEADQDFAVFWTRNDDGENVPNLLRHGNSSDYKGVTKIYFKSSGLNVFGSNDRKVYFPEDSPPKTLDQLRGEAFAEMSDELTAEMFEDYSQSVQQSSKVNYYEGNITPSPNTIFVFGSNPEGRHGAGAAKIAKDKFGAKYGQGKGLQGNAYAIPTKDLRVKENKGLKSISRYEIQGSIQKMYDTARANPDKQFKVAYRNTTEVSLNGYTGLEMIDMFNVAAEYDLILNTTPGIPSNVIFSKEWFDTGKLNIQPTQQISEAKEGVFEVFKDNPRLASIGTEQQYSEYLNSIFPESKIKDIVYHSTNTKFKEFDTSKAGSRAEGAGVAKTDKGAFGSGMYFTPNSQYTKVYGKNTHAVILNIENPKTIINNEGDNTLYTGKTINELWGKDIDGVIQKITDWKKFLYKGNPHGTLKDFQSVGLGFKPEIVDVVVSNSEQIHVLGSKKDIQGFKEFVGKPTQQASEAKSENISSKGSQFAKKLTNPGNNLKVTYKGREFRNAEHAYQTYKSGEFDQKAYNSNAFKPVGSKPANRNTNYQTMVDILKAKLEQHPELIEGINKRGGLAYIKESTHNVTGDKFWESKGQNKFIEALADAYQSIAPTQQSSEVEAKVDLSKEWRGDLESRPVYTKEGINTMRTSAADSDEHFGNPWSEGGYRGTIKTATVEEAIQKYKEWLMTSKTSSVKTMQRAWILDQIEAGKLEGATLLYAGKLAARGKGTHAHALAEIINRNKDNTKENKTECPF